ncbi:MAG: EamA family transporter RarD [Phycisphaeraceae bacterium]|jgi:chloramphenicol-sensitive protein RarD|nr:MAG: EamA family transporter RarD [Phycisphaeraceae bacterium]
MVHQHLRLPCHALSLDRLGLVYALAAYVWWGLVTGAYFKSVDFAEPLELLALRVLTGLPLLIVFLSFRAGGIRDLLGLVQTQPISVLVAGALIGLNWGTFIYAVVSSRLTEASLGYYINPLLSVLLGVFVLGESMTPRRWLALVVALIGAFVFASDFEVSGLLQAGRLVELPWIVVVLPLSFGLYGLAKKKTKADPFTSLAGEMLMLLPVLGLLEWCLFQEGRAVWFSAESQQMVALWVGGIVTIVPLLFFSASAKRLPLSVVGLMQYIAPTLQFTLAVVFFGEQLSVRRLMAFVMVWVSIGFFLSSPNPAVLSNSKSTGRT